MGRPAHKPDPAQRRQVEAMAAYGIPEVDISRVVGVDSKTLRKHYREELDLGETKANAQVAGFLFNSARNVRRRRGTRRSRFWRYSISFDLNGAGNAAAG